MSLSWKIYLCQLHLNLNQILISEITLAVLNKDKMNKKKINII